MYSANVTAQEILQRYTARQLRLAFIGQLWNAKVDFSESLMAGEVKNIEATFNVCGVYFHLGTDGMLMIEQNFFANVKAQVSQARADGPSLDGKHHYEGSEIALTQACVGIAAYMAWRR